MAIHKGSLITPWGSSTFSALTENQESEVERPVVGTPPQRGLLDGKSAESKEWWTQKWPLGHRVEAVRL